jgi:ADP-ribosylglycohydrolase
MNPTPEMQRVFLRLLNVEPLRELLRMEIRQRQEEGFDAAGVMEELERRETAEELVELHNEILNAPRVKDFPYFEPETLDEIRRARPYGPRGAVPELEPEALFDRIHGGWLGRVAGCVLGKPVEPFGYWGKIADYLRLANSYPLCNYIPRLDPVPDDTFINHNAAGSYLGEINGAPDDDDTDYTILGLHMLESYGEDFTTDNVAAEWLAHLAFHKTWTAERTVYRNLILGVSPTEAAYVLNPEREYIGARIRADIYGLTCPGNPKLAAELAFRDASLTHTKNGVYSAMFTAACIAWAFVTSDIEKIFQVGLSEIPVNCRQAEAIREVLAIRQEIDVWETAYERLLDKFARYHPVHAINNTAWMVLAMLYGQGDFEKTVCTAVLCGFDTDCNAANAGTVLGVISGAEALPRKWTDPLNDILRSAVSQFSEMHISDLARRTAVLADKSLSKVSSKE